MDVAIQPDGRIVAVGLNSWYDVEGVGGTNLLMARFNANGSLDPMFGPWISGGGPDQSAAAVALMPSGTIVFGGSGNTWDDGWFGPQRFLVGRTGGELVATITGGPAGPTSVSSPAFDFTVSEADSTAECRLDGPGGAGSYAPCTSPKAYSALADGDYTFSVRAVDAAGTTRGYAETQSFTVDTRPPETTITSGPGGPGHYPRVGFEFTAIAGSTFECKLDGPGAATGSYARCGTPTIYDGLADGNYTFSVRATAAGTTGPPATRSFSIDTVPPVVTITGGPSGTTSVTSPQFSWTTSGGPIGFMQCTLFGPGNYIGDILNVPCTSPYTVGPLIAGDYRLMVWVTDTAGPRRKPATHAHPDAFTGPGRPRSDQRQRRTDPGSLDRGVPDHDRQLPRQRVNDQHSRSAHRAHVHRRPRRHAHRPRRQHLSPAQPSRPEHRQHRPDLHHQPLRQTAQRDLEAARPGRRSRRRRPHRLLDPLPVATKSQPTTPDPCTPEPPGVHDTHTDAFLAEAGEGRGGALALVGEPGVGKSALLRAARARAGGAMHVLSATGAEAETDLPFAALLSLLRPVLDRVGVLPEVQRQALEGALALGPPAAADLLAVHAAALGMLIAAGQQRPLLLLVDDAHWLDPRLGAGAAVRGAAAGGGTSGCCWRCGRRRDGRSTSAASSSSRRPGLGRARRGAARRAAGRALPAAVVERLHSPRPAIRWRCWRHRATCSAPARGARSARRPAAGRPRGAGCFRRRLERLPAPTRTALLLAAASGNEPLYRLEARRASASLADLAAAEAADLIEVERGGVRFRHPLVRAAAYGDAPAPERRAVHAALADRTTGARRADHLWAAAAGPDEEAAAALEAAADDARARTGLRVRRARRRARRAADRRAPHNAPGGWRARHRTGS